MSSRGYVVSYLYHDNTDKNSHICMTTALLIFLPHMITGLRDNLEQEQELELDKITLIVQINKQHITPFD